MKACPAAYLFFTIIGGTLYVFTITNMYSLEYTCIHWNTHAFTNIHNYKWNKLASVGMYQIPERYYSF